MINPEVEKRFISVYFAADRDSLYRDGVNIEFLLRYPNQPVHLPILLRLPVSYKIMEEIAISRLGYNPRKQATCKIFMKFGDKPVLIQAGNWDAVKNGSELAIVIHNPY